MRYRVRIEIAFLAGGEAPSASALAALTTALRAGLPGDPAAPLVCDLDLSVRSDHVVVVDVDLRGASPDRFTNPRDALVAVDEALNRSLLSTGLFEEFDMAGRSLFAGPAVTARSPGRPKINVSGGG